MLPGRSKVLRRSTTYRGSRTFDLALYVKSRLRYNAAIDPARVRPGAVAVGLCVCRAHTLYRYAAVCALCLGAYRVTS